MGVTVINQMIQYKLYAMKRVALVLSVSGLIFLIWWMNSEPDGRFKISWTRLIGNNNVKSHINREVHERCQVANLDLNQFDFLTVLNKDNQQRGDFVPKCIPSSWKRIDFDYNSKLVRLRQNNQSFWQSVSCCYIPFERKIDDDTATKISPTCYNISENMSLPPEHEFIIIKCKKNDTVIYSDLLGYVPIKPNVEKRISDYEKEKKSTESDHKRVNVVIFGLDAVSKYNLLRYLPKTHEYILKNLSGIEFSKYHRTAGYSFDNMACGFHMGLTRQEVVEVCWPNKDAFLDTCPLIWKEFAAKGFRTSYAEDAALWSIFYYTGDCKGFARQPTDYDYTTLTRRLEYIPGKRKNCYADKFCHQVILDNIVRTAVTLENKLYFQFSWICSITHNVPILTKYIGDSIIKMFEDLKERNLINNTVFIFTADHGMNFGDPAKTIQGTIEANFPFFFMIFPKWFSQKYPRAMKNLKRNSELLTSHFDSHETLKDFLDLSLITDEALEKREKDKKLLYQRGISFFLPIAKNRDCEAAGIMSQYCSCWKLQDVPADHYLIQESKESFVAYLKNYFGSKYEQCKNIIRFGPVENSKCTIPNSDELAKRIKQLDYSRLGVEPHCDFQMNLFPEQNIIQASMKKSNGTWTILQIKFSSEPKYDISCSDLVSDPNAFCNCVLTNEISM